MNKNELKAALLTQETYRDTSPCKEKVLAGDFQTIQLCTKVIQEVILLKTSQPMQILLALRLGKELMDLQIPDYIRQHSQSVLPAMELLAVFKKEDQSDVRGKFFFGEQATKQEQQIGNSLFRLIMDSIKVWAHQYPTDPQTQKPSPYKSTYDRLINQGVTFPKLSYFKDADLTKKLTSQSEILGVQKQAQNSSPISKNITQSTVVVPQQQQLQKSQTINDSKQQQKASQAQKVGKSSPENVKPQAIKFLKELQLEKELIGDLLTSDEGSEELEMLEECVTNLQTYQTQCENLLLEIMDLDFKEKDQLLEDLVSQQDFIDEFIVDYQQWQQQKMTFHFFKQKYLGICSATPNPAEQTPNPDQHVEHNLKKQPTQQKSQSPPQKTIGQSQQIQGQDHDNQRQLSKILTKETSSNQFQGTNDEQFQHQASQILKQSTQPQVQHQTSKVQRESTVMEKNEQEQFSHQNTSMQATNKHFDQQKTITKFKDENLWQDQAAEVEGSVVASNINQQAVSASIAKNPTAFHMDRSRNISVPGPQKSQTLQDIKEDGYEIPSRDELKSKMGPNSSYVAGNHHSPRNNVRQGKEINLKAYQPSNSNPQSISNVVPQELLIHNSQTELVQKLHSELAELKKQNTELEFSHAQKQREIKVLSNQQLSNQNTDQKITTLLEENNNLRTEMKVLKEHHFNQQKAISEKMNTLQREKAQLLEDLSNKVNDFNRLIEQKDQGDNDQDMILHLTKENSQLLQDNKKWQMLSEKFLKQVTDLQAQLNELKNKSLQNQQTFQQKQHEVSPKKTKIFEDHPQNAQNVTQYKLIVQPQTVLSPVPVEIQSEGALSPVPNANPIPQPPLDGRSKNTYSWIQNSQHYSNRQKRSESQQHSGGPNTKEEEYSYKQLQPRFNSKFYNTSQLFTPSPVEKVKPKKQPAILPTQYKELIFPYSNPLDYYCDKISKPSKGRQVTQQENLCAVTLDQKNQENLKFSILKKKHCLFQSKYLMVGVVMEPQLNEQQKQVKLGLYFISQSKATSLDVVVSYQLNQEEYKITPSVVQELFTLESDNQEKHEFVFGLQRVPCDLQTAQIEVKYSIKCILKRFNSRQVIYELHLPITILAYMDFQKIKLPAYKKLWRSSIPYVVKSDSFKTNSNIIQDDEISKYFPEIIGLNPNKRDQYRAGMISNKQYFEGIDEIKYGGIWSMRFTASKYLVRFVLRPTQEMIIQVAQLEGEKDAKFTDSLVNTLVFVFSE